MGTQSKWQLVVMQHQKPAVRFRPQTGNPTTAYYANLQMAGFAPFRPVAHQTALPKSGRGNPAPQSITSKVAQAPAAYAASHLGRKA